MPGINKTSVNPLDYRYQKECSDLVRDCFSEEAHIRECFNVEFNYWRFVTNLITGTPVDLPVFDLKNMSRYYEIAKQYEKICKHDIKAIEWAVRDYVTDSTGSDKLTQFIHYGLTSQDIVSYSVNKRLKYSMDTYIIPEIELLVKKLQRNDFVDGYIYCRTHGQRGNITTFTTELNKYRYRINREIEKLKNIQWTCKFSGSTGDFTTFDILHPNLGIQLCIGDFLDQITGGGMDYSAKSTQTDNWRSLCDCFNILREISNILIDLSRDLWLYHMNGDIKQKNINKLQAGSSVMPQKVNPITIENAEGNLEMCDMWFTFLTSKFAKSRLQRDLSDSVVIRNIGVPVCNFHLALWNICIELDNIEVVGITNLDYSVFGELVQTKLRLLGETDAYERTKTIFRTGVSMNAPKFFTACGELFGSHDWSDIHKYVESVKGVDFSD